MKFSTKIFCLFSIAYILILSWQPCEDLTSRSNPRLKTSGTQIGAQDNQEPNEKDDCSPFCICSCCQTSFASNNFNFQKAEIVKVKIVYKAVDSYKNPYKKNHNSDIWQPPKTQA